MPPVLISLIPGIFDLFKRLIPDPEEQAKAQMQVLQLMQQLDQSQLEVNKAEANSGNWFASSWRPSLGYICVFAYFYTYVLSPFLNYYLTLKGIPTLPVLDQSQLDGVLYGMLGLGTLRSVEKVTAVVKKGK